ncbi:ScyD/ScyE family protein [Seongchinamella unica]|nr:ScyD/ScyE family protein [Seongchinamella unica]
MFNACKCRAAARGVALAVAILLLFPTVVNAQPLVSGLQGSAGSTVGPDGHLYVTEGATGTVQRINPSTGAAELFTEGLPPWVIPGLGGAVDVAFIEETAYVLVTLINFEGEPSGLTNGIYRIDGPDSHTIIADLGAFNLANPPQTAFAIPTGVQWSLEVFRGGLLVSDGHLNRVLQVTQDGAVSILRSFDNIVPTGMDVSGHTIYMARPGPTPHSADDGQIVSFGPGTGEPDLVASGAPLLLDVEFGRGRSLYALSQGQWNGDFAGSPAVENDGTLWEVNNDASLRLIADGINLPNSVEIIGTSAFVVTLTGEVWRYDEISDAPFGHARGR